MKQWISQPPRIHREWLDKVINEAQDKLNRWETTFIESIERQLDMRVPLSQAQEEKLESIYSNYTD